MIEPTVGRIVYVRLNNNQLEPLPAIITQVHSNTQICVTVFNIGGSTQGLDIQLYQGNEIKPPNPYPYAEWMPYQKAVAAKEK